MRTFIVGVAVAAGWCAESTGQVTGAMWLEVDNTSADPVSDVVAGSFWMSQAGWRTFDLYAIGAVGQAMGSVNFAGDFPVGAPGLGLRVVGGVIFNHAGASGDGGLESSPLLQSNPAFNLTRFDTFATLGNANLGGTMPSEMILFGFVQGLRGSESTGPVMGTWGANPGVFPPQNSVFGPSGLMRMLRITVSDSVTDLSGRFQAGLGSGGVVTLDIPNAIPSPGSLAVVSFAGVALASRRRR